MAVVLLGCTACLEHFEVLETRVVYDPYAQQFDVVRRLVGIDPTFLGCGDVVGCVAAIDRTLALAPDPTRSMALADRLLQRLVDSGATEVGVTLERDGDRLDAVVRYHAPVGSAAADDTLVRAEWDSRTWLWGHYYLVVTAQDSMEPPAHYRTRKVARSGASGVDWVEEWILPRRQRSVETSLDVGSSDAMFAAIPGLADALEARGWLDQETAVADAADRPPTAVLVASRDDAGGRRSAEPSGIGLDPDSPAKTWVYEARVSGGGVTAAAAAVAVEPLVAPISRCYQKRQVEVPTLEGSVFLSALVRADGTVVGTSVSGSISDAPFLACLDRATSGWRFAAWGSGDEVSDVAIPVVFRVEKPPPRDR